MSLINQMLKDLDSRQALDARSDRPLFSSLHVASAPSRRLPWRTLLLGVVTFVAVMFFVWDKYFSAIPLPVVAQPKPLTPLAPVAESARQVEAPATKPEPIKPVVAQAQAKTPPRAVSLEPKPPVASRVSNESGPARMEKIERPYSPQEIAERTVRDAERLRLQGNLAEAERQLEILLARQPTASRARELLATMQVESGRWPRAQSTLEQGIQQEPRHLSYRTQLARLQMERNELPAAIATLDAARVAVPNNADLLAFLAALQQRASHHSEAVARYREALAIKPNEGRWWVGLGISLESEKQNSDAANAYRQALSGAPIPTSLNSFASERLKGLSATR